MRTALSVSYTHLDVYKRQDNLNTELVKKIRVGIFLFPALLKRFRTLEIPFPGGCNIGKRPIDEHIRGFEAF